MSSGNRINRDQVIELLYQLMPHLEPYCTRIAIAGSVRRLVPEVGDIELVCILNTQADIFGEQHPLPTSCLELSIARRYRILKAGEKYIQFVLGPCNCDLYITTPEKFGVTYALRTGPAEFSKRMVTSQMMSGYLPFGMFVDQGRLWRGSTVLDTPEEENFFQTIGLNYIPPEERK